ncbi:hypothetical protein WSK_3322 [Novosphingobium sp. Rr 2-17]|uniref:nuclear transport factor 2 family protein n=1 Tax=Novosphingobium sp. Rr 2-17 TaxID=555793 RepID=UPI0002698F22|nr:hypothetical protein [Novosphingobium sp. Rr 2-17]EIZ78109.1 hypothetical protein WSK_3322 [Novosphingobium sp. Rr 2-17]
MTRKSSLALWLGMPAMALPGTVLAAPSQDAATQIDEGEANVAIVKRFLSDLRAAMMTGDAAKIRAVAERYMAADYIQHSSAFPPGREGYITAMTKFNFNAPPGAGGRPPGAGGPPPGAGGMPKDLQFVGNRDYVMWMSEAPPGPGSTSPSYAFNAFRISKGKLVEHWGSM